MTIRAGNGDLGKRVSSSSNKHTFFSMNKIDNMRYIKVLLLFFMVGLMGTAAVHAQESYTINDTIFNPKLVFNGVPSKYEIAGIKVSGVDN